MQEKQLLKICIIISIIGLSLLYLYSEEIELKPIRTIEESKVDQVIKLQGKVNSLSQQEKIAFLDVENEKIELTKVILFKDEDIWLKEGDYVEITGTVEDYKGEKEIIANKVTVKGR